MPHKPRNIAFRRSTSCHSSRIQQPFPLSSIESFASPDGARGSTKRFNHNPTTHRPKSLGWVAVPSRRYPLEVPRVASSAFSFLRGYVSLPGIRNLLLRLLQHPPNEIVEFEDRDTVWDSISIRWTRSRDPSKVFNRRLLKTRVFNVKLGTCEGLKT